MIMELICTKTGKEHIYHLVEIIQNQCHSYVTNPIDLHAVALKESIENLDLVNLQPYGQHFTKLIGTLTTVLHMESKRCDDFEQCYLGRKILFLLQTILSAHHYNTKSVYQFVGHKGIESIAFILSTLNGMQGIDTFYTMEICTNFMFSILHSHKKDIYLFSNNEMISIYGLCTRHLIRISTEVVYFLQQWQFMCTNQLYALKISRIFGAKYKTNTKERQMVFKKCMQDLQNMRSFRLVFLTIINLSKQELDQYSNLKNYKCQLNINLKRLMYCFQMIFELKDKPSTCDALATMMILMRSRSNKEVKKLGGCCDMIDEIMKYWPSNPIAAVDHSLQCDILFVISIFSGLSIVDTYGNQFLCSKNDHQCHDCKILIHLLLTHDLVKNVSKAARVELLKMNNAWGYQVCKCNVGKKRNSFLFLAAWFLHSVYQELDNHCYVDIYKDSNHVNHLENCKVILQLLNAKHGEFRCRYFASAALVLWIMN